VSNPLNAPHIRCNTRSFIPAIPTSSNFPLFAFIAQFFTHPDPFPSRYEVTTRCGIPEVTLLGSVADWSDLRARFLVLADTWMHRSVETCAWVKEVDAMLKEFEAARSGECWLLCCCVCVR